MPNLNEAGQARLESKVAKRDERIDDLEAEVEQLRLGLKQLRTYNADVRDGLINYRPEDHIQVADKALECGIERPSRADYRAEVERLRGLLKRWYEQGCHRGMVGQLMGDTEDALDTAEDDEKDLIYEARLRRAYGILDDLPLPGNRAIDAKRLIEEELSREAEGNSNE